MGHNLEGAFLIIPGNEKAGVPFENKRDPNAPPDS
jgi:hypothetical protein